MHGSLKTRRVSGRSRSALDIQGKGANAEVKGQVAQEEALGEVQVLRNPHTGAERAGAGGKLHTEEKSNGFVTLELELNGPAQGRRQSSAWIVMTV